jgi:hypothetical protein
MNSFLFNTLLLLLASVTVVQFCSDALALYNRFTGIDSKLLFDVLWFCAFVFLSVLVLKK